MALAKKHRNQLTGNNVKDSAASAMGAATSKAGNEYAKATDDASLKTQESFDSVVGSWSDSRLKAFLDARGVPVPQGGKKNELIKQVRLNKNKASSGYSAWTFDTWNTENLKYVLSATEYGLSLLSNLGNGCPLKTTRPPTRLERLARTSSSKLRTATPKPPSPAVATTHR